MSNATKGLRRAGIGGLTAAVALGTLIASGGVANATTNYDLTRVFGQSRYDTSVAAVKLAFSSSDNVVLASGDTAHTVDALGANYLAGVLGAPVLLTKIDETPDAVAAEITALGAKNVWVVGGKAAVSDAQLAALDAKFDTVKRVSGANRYETDKAVVDAADNFKVGTVDGKKVAFVASGTSFADALSAGAISWKANLPVIITGRGSLDANAKAALAEAGIEKVYVLGGGAVISDDVVSQLTALGYAPERVFGATRSETSTKLAQWGMDKGIISTTVLHIASGQESLKGADALSGAAVAGKFGQGLVVTDTALNAGNVDDFVKAHANMLTGGVVFGGPTAIADGVVSAIETAGKAVTSNQSIAVTPQGSTTLTRVAGASDGDTSDDRQYSVSGLDSSKTYTVALFSNQDVVSGADGQLRFVDAGSNKAQRSSVSADLTVVNGAPAANGAIVTVSPVNGTISFTVDGDAANETVVPVVWLDNGSTSGVLDLVAPSTANSDPKVPAEAFGVGGATTYVPGEAATAAVGTDAAITAVDKSANTFSTAGALYKYDSNDNFYVAAGAAGDETTTVTEANRVTMEDFEAALSRGDEVDKASFYQRTTALSSTFVLENLSPAAPASLSATSKVTNTSIKVTWSAPSTGAVDSYNVYRTSTNPAAAASDVSKYTKVGTVAGDASTLAFTDSGLSADTTYYYAVTAVQDGDESAPATTSQKTAASAPDTLAPKLTDAQVVTDTGLVGIADAGDEYQLTFSEDMNASTALGTLRVVDADGTIAEIKAGNNGTAADPSDDTTFVLGNVNAAGDTIGTDRVLTIHLGTTPSAVTGAAGSVPGLQYPVTITNVSAGVADEAGNTVDLAGSTDKTIN